MKRKGIKILILLVALVSGIKIYYVMGDCKFNFEYEQMKRGGLMNYEIKTGIEHKTLTVNENIIHYYVSGKKSNPAILFIHPAFSDHSCFYKQVDFFSQEFRVITIDLIGHGLSEVRNNKDKIDNSTEHIFEILNAENIEKLHIAGVSMGALIAQHFALKHPDKTLSLTSLGGYNINRIDKRVENSQRKEQLGWIIRVIFSMDSFRKYLGTASAIKKENQIKYFESAQGFSRKSFTIMSGLNKLIEDRPNLLRNYPLLILAGENDNDLVKQMAEIWHLAEPGSKFHYIEQSGHCANMDNPESFNEIVYNTIKDI